MHEEARCRPTDAHAAGSRFNWSDLVRRGKDQTNGVMRSLLDSGYTPRAMATTTREIPSLASVGRYES
jgi:hypothetical protein